ncbi:MAG TPA: metallophosphoesterase [Acidobacteriota bacterium]|nr:metallophosphoesterase [Acidobacteriota bacterium]HNH82309.1 metallophosphoesterase [Acidobacteriota bacterium]
MVTVANLRKDGTLSWLHLSDIHFGEAQGTGRDAVLNRLIDDVRELRERDQLAPDLIFITGDIAWSGKPNQYEKQAKPFLEKLQAAADVEPSRIFLIPGNHDVDRSQIKSIALKKFQEDLIAPPAGENAQKFVTDFLTWDDFQDDRERLLLKSRGFQNGTNVCASSRLKPGATSI